jgi:hypothetical protein
MASILNVLLVVTIQTICYANVTKLPAEDRKALQEVSRFQEVHSTTDLPPAVVALCTNGDGKIVEPGQKWNATYVITDPTLPGKRLIWAAMGGEHYVVHYERGIAHSFHMLVAKLAKNDAKPKLVWRAVGNQPKITPRFSTHCEPGSWTTVWIRRIERRDRDSRWIDFS